MLNVSVAEQDISGDYVHAYFNGGLPAGPAPWRMNYNSANTTDGRSLYVMLDRHAWVCLFILELEAKLDIRVNVAVIFVRIIDCNGHRKIWLICMAYFIYNAVENRNKKSVHLYRFKRCSRFYRACFVIWGWFVTNSVCPLQLLV